MTEAYIFDAIRTPRGKGKKNGSLHEVQPINLVTTLLKALQERNDFDTKEVEDIILGCVTPIGDQGADIAKVAALAAGWDDSVCGMQINRFCASALEAANTAAEKVRSGWHDLIVAGGVESMSRIPMGSDGGAWFLDPMTNYNSYFVPQGVSADLIATLEGFSREDLDSYAVLSQQRAAKAKAEGYFDKSIIPIKDINGLTILAEDEFNRPGTTLEDLAKLSPSFQMPGEMGFDAVALQRYPHLSKINHVHHAGNSSGIVDGAALVLIGTKEKGQELGLKPRARIRMAAHTSAEPTIMLVGPGPASQLALKKAGMTINDIDVVEMNEAFAAAVLRLQKDINVPMDKLNVNGGAIALGHPLGATGAMILGTALDEIERRDQNTALVTLCIGGGMGVTTIIERV
ncbi:MAG: acetyl-CoA C-acetyltransferase [Chitinophagales bacterium]|nr:acetyl-CoA C-acetyltransferase [Chitinophagales bacterium]